MISVIVMVCSLSTGECNGFVPDRQFYGSIEQCESLNDVTVDLFHQSQPNMRVAYRCINWGVTG